MNEKSKGKGRAYQVRNVTGRKAENEANRTGLDSTTLHYLAVRQAIVSVHDFSFKHHANLLTYLADWLPYTLENGFQSDIKGQGDPFLDFCF